VKHIQSRWKLLSLSMLWHDVETFHCTGRLIHWLGIIHHRINYLQELQIALATASVNFKGIYFQHAFIDELKQRLTDMKSCTLDCLTSSRTVPTILPAVVNDEIFQGENCPIYPVRISITIFCLYICIGWIGISNLSPLPYRAPLPEKI